MLLHSSTLLDRYHGDDLCRPFYKSLSQSPAFVGQYNASDKNVKMMIFDPKKDPSIWEEYMAGLTLAYSKHGVEARANLDDTILIAAAVKQNDGGDYMIGGGRIEGPFDRALDIPMIRGISKFKGAELVVNRVEELCFNHSSPLIVEAQGVWKNDPTFSAVGALARAVTHLKWFINADFMAAASAEHTLESYRANAGCDTGDWLNLPKGTSVPTFRYPDERYQTKCMMNMPTYMDVLDGPTRKLVRHEQRVLEPFKQLYLQQQQQQQQHTVVANQCAKKDVCSPDEIVLDLDSLVKELQDSFLIFGYCRL